MAKDDGRLVPRRATIYGQRPAFRSRKFLRCAARGRGARLNAPAILGVRHFKSGVVKSTAPMVGTLRRSTGISHPLRSRQLAKDDAFRGSTRISGSCPRQYSSLICRSILYVRAMPTRSRRRHGLICASHPSAATGRHVIGAWTGSGHQALVLLFGASSRP